MRVTAKVEPSERGLARICQGPRGYIVSLDGKVVGHVSVSLHCPTRREEGWYFYASVGQARINSCEKLLPTKEEARAACIAWVKAEALKVTQ